jgi:hypothetical protein
MEQAVARLVRRLLAVVTLLVGGCFPTLYTDTPLGEPVTFDASEWNGLWICLPDGELGRIRVAASGSSKLDVASDWRECDLDKSELWSTTLEPAKNKVFRRYGDWYFTSCKEGRLQTGEPCEIDIFTVLRVGDSIQLAEPDETRIRKLLDEGKVPGRVEFVPSGDRLDDARVVFHSLTADHSKLLFDPDNGAFRVVLGSCIRLPAELDPCNKAK